MKLFDEVELKLIKATISSCSCLTKTPEVQFHKEHCNYRLVIEAREAVNQLREPLEKVRQLIQQIESQGPSDSSHLAHQALLELSFLIPPKGSK